jgi:hypothetical protein
MAPSIFCFWTDFFSLKKWRANLQLLLPQQQQQQQQLFQQ